MASLAGCGGGALPRASDKPAAGKLGISLPAPGEVVKETRAVEVRLLPAIDYLDTDPDYYDHVYAEEATKQLVFTGDYPPGSCQGLDGLAYCLYQFTVTDHAAAPKLRWQWQGAEPSAGEFWIGLPDVTQNAWTWYEAGSGALDFPDLASCLEGDDLVVALVIMAPSGSEYRLDWVKIGGPVFQAQAVQEPEDGVGGIATAIVNERPAIAYVTTAGTNLYFVRANDNYGWSWGAPVWVATAGGNDISLAMVNGRPAIVFDSLAGPVGYVRAKDMNGSTWNDGYLVTTANGSGEDCSLAVVAGKPAVGSYWSVASHAIFTSSIDSDGLDWNSSITIDTTDYAYGYTSLAVVDGNPAIAYIAQLQYSTQLRFARAGDAAGTTWANLVEVAGTWLPTGVCLKVVNGYPAVSYKSNTDINYVVAKDAQGAEWWTPMVFDIESPGDATSLAVINGRPAIAFSTYDGTYHLYYVRATDAYGSNWEAPRVLDTDDAGKNASLLEVRGQAAMAYGDGYTSDHDALKYGLLVE